MSAIQCHTCFVATDDTDTDILDEPITQEELVKTFTGPVELMDIMSNLLEDQDGYDLIADNTEDDHSQGSVVLLPSEEDENKALPVPDVNFFPLMGNLMEFQDVGRMEELPIIEEVVISGPNEYSKTHYMSNSMQPPPVQQQMMNIMEEISQFANGIVQEMKNRFRPIAYDEWMVPDTVGDHNLPIRVIPIEWHETAKDDAMDVAERDQSSYGAVTKKVDTPSAEDEAPSNPGKSKDIDEAAQHELASELKPKVNPEEKVLIRTERVTDLEELPADKPLLQVIQYKTSSTEEGRPAIK